MATNNPTTEHPEIELERYLTTMRDISKLASELGVSKDYVSAMRFHGFKMPGGKASIRMARSFLESCPEFAVRKSRDGITDVKDLGGEVVATIPPIKGRRQAKQRLSAASSGK